MDFLDRIKQKFAPVANEDVANKAYVDAVGATKANASHTHTIANVTNLQTALDGKAASSHTHTASQITDLAAAIASAASVESTWLYPNGTKASPGLLNANMRVTVPSPWPGYVVTCKVQGYSGGKWRDVMLPGYAFNVAYGTYVAQRGDEIQIETTYTPVDTWPSSEVVSPGSPFRLYCEKGGPLP